MPKFPPHFSFQNISYQFSVSLSLSLFLCAHSPQPPLLAYTVIITSELRRSPSVSVTTVLSLIVITTITNHSLDFLHVEDKICQSFPFSLIFSYFPSISRFEHRPATRLDLFWLLVVVYFRCRENVDSISQWLRFRFMGF